MWRRVLVLVLAAAGCVDRQDLGTLPARPDAGSTVLADATAPDAGAEDASSVSEDATPDDAAPGDAAPRDAEVIDAEAPDAGSEDRGLGRDAQPLGGLDAQPGADAAIVPNANRLIGYPCVASNQCLNGQGICLPEDQFSEFNGGYCSAVCTNTPCPADAVCVAVDGAPDLCFDECGRNSDCRPGYGCVDAPPSAICFPQNPVLCRLDVDCTSAGRPRCDKPTGACVECLADSDCTGGDLCSGSVCIGRRPNGSACSDGGDCLGQSCQPKAYAPDGYCTQNCASDLDCTAGGHCGVYGECQADCTNATDCRPGYGCLDGDGDFLLECRATGTGTGTVGASCATVTDCQGGLGAVCRQGFGLGPTFVGGYCSEYCGPGACPTGSSCVGLSLAQYCLADCAVDADCRQPDYRCLPIGGGVSSCYPR
ncbi:MAG: hypothetical protein IPG45_28545 [Deltaproteobacteria bacterium]|nr:hypothetical protein [Deltaproteobacteria bacterium]